MKYYKIEVIFYIFLLEPVSLNANMASTRWSVQLACCLAFVPWGRQNFELDGLFKIPAGLTLKNRQKKKPMSLNYIWNGHALCFKTAKIYTWSVDPVITNATPLSFPLKAIIPEVPKIVQKSNIWLRFFVWTNQPDHPMLSLSLALCQQRDTISSVGCRPSSFILHRQQINVKRQKLRLFFSSSLEIRWGLVTKKSPHTWPDLFWWTISLFPDTFMNISAHYRPAIQELKFGTQSRRLISGTRDGLLSLKTGMGIRKHARIGLIEWGFLARATHWA